MKIISALLSIAALSQDGLAFSFQKGAAFRTFRARSTGSTLSMSVKENEAAKIIKVGVIGCGRIGLVHLEAISKAPGVIPIIVSNPTVSKAENGKMLLASTLNVSIFRLEILNLFCVMSVDCYIILA
jgi:hypothetical protein